MATKKNPVKAGRKPKKIDFEQVKHCCEIHCTLEETAAVLGISEKTLRSKIETEYKLTFAEFYAQHQGKGKASLRRVQWQVAQDGSVPMLIWLGKQYLGQADKIDTKSEITGDPMDSRVKDLIERADKVWNREKAPEIPETENSRQKSNQDEARASKPEKAQGTTLESPRIANSEPKKKTQKAITPPSEP
jgi:hypothetical protein